eukprot:8435374-Pyramimonas_sp.AAC.1
MLWPSTVRVLHMRQDESLNFLVVVRFSCVGRTNWRRDMNRMRMRMWMARWRMRRDIRSRRRKCDQDNNENGNQNDQ